MAAVSEPREIDQVVVVVLMALENLPLTCLVENRDLDAFYANLHDVVGCGFPCVELVN